MNGKKKGFTLIELLVVVLIIGILAAIALPQYQKAVLKSRYTTLMPIAKGIAEGNEAYFMEHSTYAEDPTELPIKGQESYPDGTVLNVVDDTDKDVSYVMATRPQLMPNNKYIVFQKHSGKFSDVTLCEATADPLATWLCKDALKGQVIEGKSLSGEGWTGYALSGDTTGSSFATALEQVAEGIKAQNSNYAIASIDEENGTITMCDINYATVGTDGKCVSAGKGVNCRSTSRFGYSNEYCDPYQIAYDEDGKVVGKTSCNNPYGCSGKYSIYVEEDESGEISYFSTRWSVAKAVYENGSYIGTNYIMINPDNSTEQYYFDIDGNEHWLRSCSNGADFNNAVCNP